MAKSFGHNSGKLTRAEEGHAFENMWRRRMFEKFKTWKSVTMRLGNGDRLTSKNLDQQARGPDLLIDLNTKDDASGRRMANKVIKAIREAKDGR
ncbi:MAG: hypothetical protein ABL901_00705 [Hyphomicrobiaceae bacterium]